MDVLKIKKLNSNACTPTRGSEQAAGLDLYACIAQPQMIEPGSRVTIPTGIAIALPEHTAGLIYARSGLATKHGLILANSVGVIDSDYRGELLICLFHTGTEPYTVQPNERIAQLIVTPVMYPVLEETIDLGSTGRGANGFGSTGRA